MFVKQDPDHFDEDAMRQLHKMFFATSLQKCEAAYPKINDSIEKGSLNLFLNLMSRYTIVGKFPDAQGGRLIDIGRTGMIKGHTEQTEFVLSLSGVDLGPLGNSVPPSSATNRRN